MSERVYTVMVVDDLLAVHKLWYMLIARFSHKHEYEFVHNLDALSAMETLKTVKPDILICDYVLPGTRNGCYVMRYCRIHHPDCFIVFKSQMSRNAYNCQKTCYDMKWTPPMMLSKLNQLEYLDQIVDTHLLSRAS